MKKVLISLDDIFYLSERWEEAQRWFNSQPDVKSIFDATGNMIISDEHKKKKASLGLELLVEIMRLTRGMDGGLLGFVCWEIFDKLPEAPQWVRVEDRLPKRTSEDEDYVWVLVKHYGTGAEPIIAKFVFECNEPESTCSPFEDEQGYSIADELLQYWMPIPPLPEVKDGA